ncbi:hypothetical protein HZC07_03175 [Candidatus Micrarchaeota archaeon]|nr:hypothetical protein [Candidatus Micrarchaeota archaeon]
MSEKKFILESDSPLQEIGMRAHVISFLMAHGIKEGNAINDPENQKKVIVALRAEDDKRINEIKEGLVQHLNKLHKNDFCYSTFPQDIKAGELKELNNPHIVVLLPLNDLASSLMLEQTSKGVGAMRYLADTLKPLRTLPEVLDGISKKL